MNLLSMSYGELAQQLGISGDRARKREARPGWSRLRGGSGVPPADAARKKTSEARPSAKTTTVIPPQKPAGEKVPLLEARIATMKGQMAALRDELARAEHMALTEQYNVVQERKKSVELKAEVQRLHAHLRDLEQAEHARSHQPWWRSLLPRRPR